MDGSLFQIMEKTPAPDNASLHCLRAEEAAVLKLLEQHLLQESQK